MHDGFRPCDETAYTTRILLYNIRVLLLLFRLISTAAAVNAAVVVLFYLSFFFFVPSSRLVAYTGTHI